MNPDDTARNAKSFVDRLVSDEAMRERLKSLEETPVAMEAFIKAEGFDCTFEEASTALRDRLSAPGPGKDGALSETQLEGVAGGGFPGMYYLAERFKLQEKGLLTYEANGEVVIIHSRPGN